MTNRIVIGLQWGDEGKGKIVDWLAANADIIVRFQGGQNAGHTIVSEGETYKLSLLPSGILHAGKVAVLGSGTVVDPKGLLGEIANVRNRGIRVDSSNLMVAENASLVLPLHKQLDVLREERSGGGSIGTTGKGIGPAYEDKIGRRAVRAGDLVDPQGLRPAVDRLVDHHNILRRGMGVEKLNAEDVVSELEMLTGELQPFVGQVWKFLRQAIHEGKSILFEGAQGTFLDIEHGTYPYVTSSATIAGGAVCGSGVGPLDIGSVLGVCKAYQTRVGNGPFPTEQCNAIGERLARKGREFGTVTGRLRRCGWFDAVMVRHACALSSVDCVAVTKLDVLDGFDELKICTHYTLGNRRLDYLPAQSRLQSIVEPQYLTLPGWKRPTAGIRRKADLPREARTYVDSIERLIETPVAALSTSPERNDTLSYADGPL
ncbi:MAG: adenylosuccinate synthase [Rhodobacteraceae bacterium]|nr:adenylosuccinate synthase [Paracoccaceae bacterium]